MKTSNRKPIFIISGTSASGKSSVWLPLKDQLEKYAFTLSCTSRKRRENEKNGVDYKFLTLKQFEAKVKDGDFLEYQEVHGDLYGTEKSEFHSIIHSGKIGIMELDVHSALWMKETYDNIILVFIRPSDPYEAIERLKKRATENKQAIETRIKRFDVELELSKRYDHVIINDNLETAQKELIKIIDKNT